MAKKKSTVSIRESNSIYMILTALISIFMLVIPFFRGLFFRINYIPAIIFVSLCFVVFIVYKLRDKDYKVFDTYLDLSVVLLPVAYLISFFFAVNAKDAFDMVLLYSSYFMMYKLTADLSAKDEKYKEIFINIIIASTFILSLTAMMSIAGIININGAYEGKRLFGLYQYANTTASVLGVGIVLTINKLIGTDNIKKVAIYQLVLTALIPSFIFTLSRGGYLVLAGILFLNFLLIKARPKLKLLLSLIVSFISSSILIYKYYTLAEEQLSAIWGYYLISIVISAVIIYFLYSFRKRINIKFSDKSVNIALIVIVIVFCGIAVLLLSVKEPIEYRIEHKAEEEKSWKYEVVDIYELEPNKQYVLEFNVRSSMESPNSYRIVLGSFDSKNSNNNIILDYHESIESEFVHKSFNFKTFEDTEWIRLLLYNYEVGSYTTYTDIVIKDASGKIIKKMEKLKFMPSMIADRIEDINLDTNNVSSRMYFLKDGIKIIKDYPLLGAGGGAWKNLYRQYQSIPYNTTEVHNFYVQYGTEVGIFGLSVLLGTLILLIIFMLRSIKENSEYLYVYLAVMLLLIHSTIDFNLSLTAVAYLLWMLIGVISGDGIMPSLKKEQHLYVRAFALSMALLVMIAAASINMGINLGNQGARASKSNEAADKTIKLYEKASALDKYNGAYRIDKAQVLTKQLIATKNESYMGDIMEQIDLVRRYEPYNHQYTPVICNIYMTLGKFELASALTEEKLKDEPLLAQSYMLKIDVDYAIADYYLNEEKMQEAVPHLERILEAASEFDRINKDLRMTLKLKEDYTEKIEAVRRTLEKIKANTIN